MTTELGIRVDDAGRFHLRTSSSSLIIRRAATDHLLLDWFGVPLPWTDTSLRFPVREGAVPGMVVTYGPTAQSQWSLGEAALAFSTSGKGDHRSPGLRVAGFEVLDFTYRSHRIVPGTLALPGLPQARAEDGTASLEITVADAIAALECRLIWTIFPESGVITANSVVRNLGAEEVVCTQLASSMIDLPATDPDLITFDGHWLGEGRAQRRPAGPHAVNSSATGSSSTEHNPGIILLDQDTTEDAGWCYGFNLVYSGSHRSTIESSPVGSTRIVSGINPEGFAWPIAAGAELWSPQCVLLHTDRGLGDLSRRMHRFVEDSIVPERWSRAERPVVMNSWEAAYYDFTADSLLKVAAAGAELGAEVFVIDDGWFGDRRDDRRALGDWWANPQRFPDGLPRFCEQLAELGLGMGLWFEPEAVSPDSELFRAHPDWVVGAPGRDRSQGRFELLLDLTRAEVRNHLVDTIGPLLDEVGVSFVKWDMNRLLSDAPSPGFQHRYLLGLYEVLRRIFEPRPQILLETCSSGGNRFDLGMLSFGPQIWASDCTDPLERLATQRGLSHLYPTSSISAHISASPNHQTGRSAPLSFRFAASALCTLGLELDPTPLSVDEVAELSAGIAWYKQWRRVIQFGELTRLPSNAGCTALALAGEDRMLVARLTGQATPRSAQLPFVAPVPDDGFYAVSQVFGDAPAMIFPGAALSHGIPTPRHTVSLRGDLFEVYAGQPEDLGGRPG